MPTCEKEQYASKELAEAALRKLAKIAKETGKGNKSWRRLNVYVCRSCGYFHVGRANQKPFTKQPKPPSPGELRRKAKHEQKALEKTAKRHARHAFEQIGFLVDVETAAKRAKYALDDFADSMAHARKMSERFVFVK